MIPDRDGSLKAALQAAKGSPEGEPLCLIRELSAIACDAELRLSPTHDEDLLERLRVLHARFRKLAADGRLGKQMDSERHRKLVDDVAIQIRNPNLRPVNLLGCKLTLDLWAPGWELRQPVLFAQIKEKLPPHDVAPWAALPIWRVALQ